MGTISKEEVADFFDYVTSELGIVLALEFTSTSPSIYLGDKVLLCERDLGDYKWAVKERILHEIAHHFEEGRRMHGSNYYKEYVRLLARFMVGYDRDGLTKSL